MLQPTALTLDEVVPTEPNVVSLSVQARLAKRLADVICIPASQITPQERHMAGDVLVDLLREAEIDVREGVRLLGVGVTGMVEEAAEQLSFDSLEAGSTEKARDEVDKVVDEVRRRFGHAAIVPATSAGAPIARPQRPPM